MSKFDPGFQSNAYGKMDDRMPEETAEHTIESTEEASAVSVSPSTSLLGWHDFASELPVEIGHYLCIWDTVPHRDFPDICSDYNVMFWCNGKWWAPVCESQPVLYWRELPPKPNGEITCEQ